MNKHVIDNDIYYQIKSLPINWNNGKKGAPCHEGRTNKSPEAELPACFMEIERKLSYQMEQLI